MARGRHSRKVRFRRTVVLAAAVIVVAGVLVWALGPWRGGGAVATGASSTTTTSPRTDAPHSTSTTSASTTTSTTGAADPLTGAQSFVTGRAGTISVAVRDLTTGQTWTLGPGTPQDEASVVKVDILETLLAQAGSGGLSSADQGLAQSMIEESDNNAATELWNTVGGDTGVGGYNADVGLADTTPSACVTCPGFPWPGWGLTTTTPSDQLDLLATIVSPNAILGDSQRQQALDLMEHVTPSERWGVTGGVPSQAVVALKNGWLPLNTADTDWQINSIGWVSGLGRNYLIAVLTTGNPSETYGIATIDQVSTDVWDSLG